MRNRTFIAVNCLTLPPITLPYVGNADLRGSLRDRMQECSTERYEASLLKVDQIKPIEGSYLVICMYASGSERSLVVGQGSSIARLTTSSFATMSMDRMGKSYSARGYMTQWKICEQIQLHCFVCCKRYPCSDSNSTLCQPNSGIPPTSVSESGCENCHLVLESFSNGYMRRAVLHFCIIYTPGQHQARAWKLSIHILTLSLGHTTDLQVALNCQATCRLQTLEESRSHTSSPSCLTATSICNFLNASLW